MGKAFAVAIYAAFAVGASAGDFTLAERGKPAECRIVVPNNSGPSYFHAAKELADHIKQMTGVDLPVVPEWKGKGAVRLEKPPAELGEEGFRICVKDGDLHVIGGKRGVYGNERIAPRVEDVKDGWQWYAFKPKKIHDGQEFYFASGRFSKGGGRAAVNGVRIDRIEISRVTAPRP